jgi:EmrB/QacA subfamily drug resistance transporter
VDEKTVHERRWWILGVLVVSLLVVVLDNTILNVALKTIEVELGASQSELEWAINSYTLVFAGLLFTYGVLGDRYGRRRILMVGLALFGLASVLAAWSQSPDQLVAARALMGVGAAAVLPSTLSIITNVFEPAERGRAIGIWAGFSGLAIAIGPITGGALLEHFWWGSVFLVNVPVVVAGLVAVRMLVPESRNPAPGRIDPLGVVLSIAGLVVLVYGIIEGGQRGQWLTPGVVLPLVAGFVLLAVFIQVERRTDHPSLDVTLFRNPRFSAASAAITLAFFALFGAMFYLTFYLQLVRGYSPFEAGLRLLPVAVAILFFAPRSARMVERFGAKAVCTTGMLLVTASFAGYQLVGTDTPIWVVEVLLFVQGTGMANVMAPATESIMSTLPRESAGAGSAVNNTVRQVGGALGVAILGSVLSASYRGNVEPALAVLPEGIRHAAGESLGATLLAAERVGGPALGLVAPAKDAFVDAMHVTSLGSALVALLGAVVVAVWLPGKDRAHAAPPADEPEPATLA